MPRDRHKTLTRLAGTEPVAGAQAAPAQRLQFFLSESTWDTDAVNARRLDVACADPATPPHKAAALVIDDSGDREAGSKTAHVARPIPGLDREDRQRHPGGHEPVGRRARSTTRCMSGRIRRPSGCPKARPIPPSAPSLGSRSNWSTRPSRSASRSWPSSPTASTARMPPSRAPSGMPACPPSWG